MELPGVCCGGTDTTVLAHSNKLADGKGMGLKARDTRAAFACMACHAVVDGQAKRPPHLSRADVLRAFEAGIEKTARLLAEPE